MICVRLLKSLSGISAIWLTLAVNCLGQQGSKNIRQRVVGCYSAGDRAVTMMRITNTHIQTRHGKQRIPYKVIETNQKENSILFELLEEDQSNFLQKFVLVIYKSDAEIIERDYSSFERYRSNMPSGRLAFVRSNCSIVTPFLK